MAEILMLLLERSVLRSSLVFGGGGMVLGGTKKVVALRCRCRRGQLFSAGLSAVTNFRGGRKREYCDKPQAKYGALTFVEPEAK